MRADRTRATVTMSTTTGTIHGSWATAFVMPVQMPWTTAPTGSGEGDGVVVGWCTGSSCEQDQVTPPVARLGTRRPRVDRSGRLRVWLAVPRRVRGPG